MARPSSVNSAVRVAVPYPSAQWAAIVGLFAAFFVFTSLAVWCVLCALPSSFAIDASNTTQGVGSKSIVSNVAAAPDTADAGPCCQQRAIVVPVVTYLVDIGLPLGLLLICAIILRARRAKATANAAAASTEDTSNSRALVPAAAPFMMLDIEESSAAEHVPTAWEKLTACLLGLRGVSGRKKSQAATTAAELEWSLAARAAAPLDTLLQSLATSPAGLSSEEAAERLCAHGPNAVEESKPPTTLALAWGAVMQPFNGLMLVVAILTASPPNSSYSTFTLIMVLLIGAIAIRFWEELRSRSLSAAMAGAVTASATVLRDGKEIVTDIKYVAPGDIVLLSAGNLVPGDIRLIEAHNLFVSMSGMTGEAMPVERRPGISSPKETALNHENICLMSTSVVSGSGKGVVVATGAATYIASLARALPSGRTATAFDRAVRRVVYLFIAFIIVMVPLVIVLSGTTTGDWSGAVSFGLAVAVGLTPQMLPMIVVANLSRSVRSMRAKKTAIRRMDAIQNLGAMDVLCTDKTGTLTVDEVTLLKALDMAGQDSPDVLKLAYANSRFQVGVPNLLDKGVLRVGAERGLEAAVAAEWTFMDEIPFDFERRMLSVVLLPTTGLNCHPMLVCKGALEELLAQCDHCLDGGQILELDQKRREAITERARTLNEVGLRVVGLATKTFTKPLVRVAHEDEAGMLFRGFLAFLDPPKESAIPCINTLYERGVSIKVLTGDSLCVAKRICADMGIDNTHCTTGAELLAAEKDDFAELIERCTVFAKVNPQQKMAIVAGLQRADHIVGFLGDGTNDALALRKADVGISVDSGTDTAKQAADVVMLDKDLATVCEGVLVGRKTYGNTIKYIKFASSSSFGNTFSILAAAIWLPFVPLQAIQVLALNVLYNISQLAIPWDTMDPEFLEKPKRWSAKFLGLYMLIIGPVSSIFDMTTFLIMWYFYKCHNDDPTNVISFQTAWFLESLMTQTFIVHLLRTENIPFVHSRATWPLMLSSFGTMAAGIAICYIPGLDSALSLTAIFPSYYAWLVGTVLAYCCAVQAIKWIYIRVLLIGAIAPSLLERAAQPLPVGSRGRRRYGLGYGSTGRQGNRDWSGAVSFWLAVAVGLNPQMLPMTAVANLSRSVRSMRAKKTAIRHMHAIQNLGAIDVLCTDKTGTLTVDEVTLLKAPAKTAWAFSNTHMPTVISAITERASALDEEGLRVVGLATRTFTMPLVLTEDSLCVAKRICSAMDIKDTHCTTGAELLAAEKDDLAELMERCSVNPQEKMAIVAGLQWADHIVVFLGDGTNDALALRQADVGISVDSGTDTAKEAADVVMLDKDLATVCEGILVGRKINGKTVKYIKFASSSSFGNTFGILAAAIWLPFVPLQAIEVLAFNILYNISQLAIPWCVLSSS
ncbi:probable magnesium-transporting ATPase, P-type 1 [Coccomyxa sp. Obi]|nr:probable magnesium-transporting ATPase, P-type 1 [Coccomyxa sp. Obi]